MHKPEQGGLKNDQSFRRGVKFSLTGAAVKVLEKKRLVIMMQNLKTKHNLNYEASYISLLLPII